MQDNRFAPPPHSANAPGDEVGAAGKGVASRSPQLASGGVPSTATPGAGGSTPGGTQIDAAGSAEPQTKKTAPTPKNAAPAPERGGKNLLVSRRGGLAGGDQ